MDRQNIRSEKLTLNTREKREREKVGTTVGPEVYNN